MALPMSPLSSVPHPALLSLRWMPETPFSTNLPYADSPSHLMSRTHQYPLLAPYALAPAVSEMNANAGDAVPSTATPPTTATAQRCQNVSFMMMERPFIVWAPESVDVLLKELGPRFHCAFITMQAA